MDEWEDQLFESNFNSQLAREGAKEAYREILSDKDDVKDNIDAATGENKNYVISISPRFRSNYVTEFQAINTQCVDQNVGTTQGTIVGKTLVSRIVQQIGGLNVSMNIDVELPGLVYPASKRLISVRLETLEPLMRTNLSGKISVPIYQCLTKDQMNCILYQYGIKNGVEDVFFVCCNHGKGVRPTKEDTYESMAKRLKTSMQSDPVESVIAELAGRMLGGVSQSRNWDLEQTYMQNIEYTIRVGGKHANALEGTEAIHEGDLLNEDLYGRDPGADENTGSAKKYQKEKKTPRKRADDSGWADTDWDKEFEGKKQSKHQHQHAVIVQHGLVLTTHKVASPRLRTAFREVTHLTGIPFDTKEELRRVTDNSEARGHFVVLLTILFKEHENNVKLWRDARGERDRIRQKTYAAYQLIQFRENGYR